MAREAAAPFVAWLELEEASSADDVEAVARALASSTGVAVDKGEGMPCDHSHKEEHGHQRKDEHGHQHSGDCCGHDHGHDDEHEHGHAHPIH